MLKFDPESQDDLKFTSKFISKLYTYKFIIQKQNNFNCNFKSAFLTETLNGTKINKDYQFSTFLIKIKHVVYNDEVLTIT